MIVIKKLTTIPSLSMDLFVMHLMKGNSELNANFFLFWVLSSTILEECSNSSSETSKGSNISCSNLSDFLYQFSLATLFVSVNLDKLFYGRNKITY